MHVGRRRMTSEEQNPNFREHTTMEPAQLHGENERRDAHDAMFHVDLSFLMPSRSSTAFS